jgi:hypothetical protein
MENTTSRRSLLDIPWWAACLTFLAIALVLTWQEHRAHILSAASWLLFLACPLTHFLMHRGHDHGEKAGQSHSEHHH